MFLKISKQYRGVQYRGVRLLDFLEQVGQMQIKESDHVISRLSPYFGTLMFWFVLALPS